MARGGHALPGLGRELLEGLVFRSSPGFELWLDNERRHVEGTTSAVLHPVAPALARLECAAKRSKPRDMPPTSCG